MKWTEKYLFHEGSLHEAWNNQMGTMKKEIMGYDTDALLNTNVDDLIEFFRSKYETSMVKLHTDDIEIEAVEEDVNVSGRRDLGYAALVGDKYLRGTNIYYLIPYEGAQSLFEMRPSTYNENPPLACLDSRHLVIKVSAFGRDKEFISAEFDQRLKEIQAWLSWVSPDIARYNEAIRSKAKEYTHARRDQILKDRDLVASLDYPLKQRGDVSTTFTPPEVRRKITPNRPPVSSEPFQPEPALEIAQYEHILEVIDSTAVMLERNPSTFRDMREEELRNLFLVSLNGHYEGSATGETFNVEGKTDILVRSNGKTVFIAECKIWKGPQSLSNAIDQLLSYTSWRDTKTALVIFNRNRDLSQVLEKIIPTVEDHPNFKKCQDYQSETGFRFILSHKDDASRDLIMTVLVFDIPLPADPSTQ